MNEPCTAQRSWLRALSAAAAAAFVVAALALSAKSLATARESSPTVFVEPPVSQVQAGEAVTVEVSVRDVVDLMAFQFTLDHDPAILQFAGVSVGPFLGSTGRNVRPIGPVTESGSVSFGATSFPGAPGPSGGGVLAEVRYDAVAPGESPIALRRVLLSDSHNTPITDTARIDGLVIVSPAVSTWLLHMPFASLP